MRDGFDRSIVESTAHRPWPMPSGPWLMTQSWNDLLFAHWRVDASQMRGVVPDVYEPVSAPFAASAGSIEYFLTERYCLYHYDRRRRPYRLDIHHRPWSL